MIRLSTEEFGVILFPKSSIEIITETDYIEKRSQLDTCFLKLKGLNRLIKLPFHIKDAKEELQELINKEG